MVANRKVTGTASSVPAGLGIGLAVSLTVTLAGAAVTAYLMENGSVRENAVGYAAMLILLIASAAGAFLAASRVKRQWMIVCLASGGCYFVSLLAMTALFFGGQYNGVGVTALLILGGSAVTGLLGLRENRGGKRRISKRVSR